MSRHQEIILGLAGQEFYFDPPEGAPGGTPTVSVYRADADDTSAAVVATTGACSVDSVSTTFGVAASAGVTDITVASGAGVTVGRRYLATNAAGEREWVEAKSVSSTAVGLRRPLANDYTTASTFKGCRLSVGVDSTWMAAAANVTEWSAGHAGYRLRWAYTVSSVACIGVSFADLVRYSAKNLVTPLDVDARFPGFIDRLPSDYQEDQGRLLVEEAFHAVRMDALGDSIVMRRIRNAEVMRELIILKAGLLALEGELMSGGGGAEAVKLAAEKYATRYAQLIQQPKAPIDEAGGGAGSAATSVSYWSK